MKNTEYFVKAGVKVTPVVIDTVDQFDYLPVFTQTQLEKLSPHILRALLTLRSGDYPMPHMSDTKVISRILQLQENS